MGVRNHLFTTAVIGSMPRPAFVRELVMRQRPVSEADYARWLDAAIGCVVALQEAAGIDVISDGEWRRQSYLGVIAELAHGFRVGRHPEDGRPWTVVVERLAPKHTGFIAREVASVKRITDRRIKVALPAPALLGERLWDPEISAKAYPTRDAFVQDCVPILRREVEQLRDQGVAIVQIDDPHLCLFVDPRVRESYADPDRAADFAVDMTNQVIEGIDGIEVAVHLCRRAGARARGEADFHGGYEPILPQLKRFRVHHIAMEFTAPGSGTMAVLRQLPENLGIGLGCVSSQPGVIDSVDAIVDRVDQALRYVDAERITLNPDCGFAPGSAAVVSIDEVYRKLCNLAAAAARLRQNHGRGGS